MTAPARERSASGADGWSLELRLYVAGGAQSSRQALRNLLAFLGESAARRIEVVDILEDPERALRDDVVIAPTLVRLAPPPTGRLVGSLSDRLRLESLLGGQTDREASADD